MTAPAKIRLLGVDDATSERLARALARELEGALASVGGEEAIVNLQPQSAERQDLGSVLAIILAGPAVVVVARILAEWVADRGYGVEITLPSGAKISLSNADKDTVERTIKAYVQG